VVCFPDEKAHVACRTHSLGHQNLRKYFPSILMNRWIRIWTLISISCVLSAHFRVICFLFNSFRTPELVKRYISKRTNACSHWLIRYHSINMTAGLFLGGRMSGWNCELFPQEGEEWATEAMVHWEFFCIVRIFDALEYYPVERACLCEVSVWVMILSYLRSSMLIAAVIVSSHLDIL